MTKVVVQACVAQLETESHPAVVRHLASVVALASKVGFVTWCLHSNCRSPVCVCVCAWTSQAPTMELAWLGDLAHAWQLLSRLHREHANSETRCALTHTMALVVGDMHRSLATPDGSAPWCGYDNVSAVVKQWCGHLMAATTDVDNIDRRYAAAQACQASTLMRPSGATTTAATAATTAATSSPRASAQACVVTGSVGVWLAALAMLQDEDDEVRDAARRAVCDGAEGWRRASGGAATDGAQAATSVVDTLAVAIAHDTLTTHYWWADRYLEYLLVCCRSVVASGSDALDAHASVQTKQLGLLSRKVFEAELDNSHLEPLVSAQYAAVHLGRVLAKRADAHASSAGGSEDSLFTTRVGGLALLTHCQEVIVYATTAVQRLKLAAQRSNWLGGPTNQGEVFTGITAAVLAATAVARAVAHMLAGDGDGTWRSATQGPRAVA